MSFSSFFSQQARKPAGLFGRFVMSTIFNKGNADLNGFVKELMAVQKNDSILEIGFGTGQLMYEKGRFSKVCTVNTLYFWPAPEKTAQKIADLLKPGGKFVVAFGDKAQLKQKSLSKDVFNLYS